MPSFHNDEDKKIWAAIEAFQFDKIKNISAMRRELYDEIIKKIGYCKECNFFSKENNICSLLKIRTGNTDRCGDFDPVETEDMSAFEVMTETFTEHQKMMEEATRINRYTHWGRNTKLPKKASDSEENTEDKDHDA